MVSDPEPGNGALQVFGEGKPFGTAAVLLLVAAALMLRYEPRAAAPLTPEIDAAPPPVA